MRVLRYRYQGREAVGLLKGDRIIDATRLADIRMIADFLVPDGCKRAAELLAKGDLGPLLSEVALQKPIDPEARIFCVGINYKDHAGEAGHDVNAQPPLFLRTHQSLVATGEPILRPRLSTHLDFECELGLLVGTAGRSILQAQAMKHVGGYTCFNDGSVRDWQKMSLTAGKNFDRSGACGPWVTLTDEITNPAVLRMTTRVNGALMQSTSVDLMIHPIPKILKFISDITELRVGDLIATGTPGGVGARRVPPVWLRHGDSVEVEVSGVGRLTNDVVDEE